MVRRSLGRPSTASAVIVRTALPPALERLRVASIRDASDGVPAHLTMLYPFLEPSRLDRGVRDSVASAAASIPPFEYDLVGPASFPDTLYVAVDPADRFVELQAALASAFPEFPIYGPDWALEFVPHVSVVEGSRETLEAAAAHSEWSALPVHRRAARLDVIAKGQDGRWRTRWRIPLGGSARR